MTREEDFRDPYCIIYDLSKYTLVVRDDKATLFRKDVTKVTAEINPPTIVKEDIVNVPTVNPYRLVLDDLKEVPFFTGKYDAKNGNKPFMFGIMTVLEYIADKAGDEEYSDMFLENMNKSAYGDKAVIKKED